MKHWTLHEALIYGHGVERPFLCPVHGDSRPSASVNTVKGVWICYSCGAHGGLTGEDALIEPDYEVMKVWLTDMMEDQREYPESWLDRWDANGVHDYWTERVGARAARAFRLGFDYDRDAATYPFRSWDGAVLGVVRRNLSGDGPKYLYPRGLDVGRYLFNYTPDARPAVVLVEGALDAIACWNVGVSAFAIYGARLSEHQIRLIDRVDPDRVYTAFDADDAGYGAHMAVERAFPHRLTTRLTWPRSWGKDVDELTETRRRKVLSDLVSDDVACVESTTCRSPESTKTSRRLRILSSPSSSTRGRLTILPQSA